jgi:hypothetical protein
VQLDVTCPFPYSRSASAATFSNPPCVMASSVLKE